MLAMDEADRKHYNILIVDDIAKNIQVLGAMLREGGYELSYATSGRQALEMVKSDIFDLVLLDVMMPQMDGFEVCSIMRSMAETADVPIIFLTAKTEERDIVEGFQVGAVDYVTKPFNSAELLARVRTHIELKAARDIIKRRSEELQVKNTQLDELNSHLQRALDEIKTLRGILPICSQCKKIRLENADPYRDESWVSLERYLTDHTEAMLSHGMCPRCMKRLYPEFFQGN